MKLSLMYLTDTDTTHINTGLTTDITIPLDVNFHIKLRILCRNPFTMSAMITQGLSHWCWVRSRIGMKN